MPKKSFRYDDIKEGYYDDIYNKKKGIRSAWHHAKFDYIKSNIDKKNIHLDIGCGPGTFISTLNNKKSYGVDISKKQIIFAKKKYASKNKNFFHYKKRLPFRKNSLDSISLIELIEHLPLKETKKILDNSYECLKKNGEIYLTTPNYLSLWPILELFVNSISDLSYQEQHITKFNKYNIKKIVNKKKFRIIKIETFLLFGPFLSFLYFNFYKKFSIIDKLLTYIFPGYLIFIKIKKV